jgi:ABC-2 type transport system permease protein
MYSIFRKELFGFFHSIMGYVVIIVFLLVCGLFMWVLPDSNIIDYGYASMEKFFDFAPWVLMFLIPAITMRTFPDEFKSNTIELLLTKPIKELQIILGKYFASIVLVLICLFPTLIYLLCIKMLATSQHYIDSGAIIGSYVGLFFLVAAFTAIGMWCSSLTSNTVVGFLLAFFGCYILYSGFEAISALPVFVGNIDYLLSQIGLQFHYKNISKGVIDTRDVIYFSSVALLFILATQVVLHNRKWEK